MKIKVANHLICTSQASLESRHEAFGVYQNFIQQKILSMFAPVPIDKVILVKEVRDWFALHDSKYAVNMRFVKTMALDNSVEGAELIVEVDISNPDVATLYKLTWGGCDAT